MSNPAFKKSFPFGNARFRGQGYAGNTFADFSPTGWAELAELGHVQRSCSEGLSWRRERWDDRGCRTDGRPHELRTSTRGDTTHVRPTQTRGNLQVKERELRRTWSV